MLDVVLYQPEIPPNTGNIIRLCANTGMRLHLIEPLGFTLDDRRLQRAGLDYHEWASIRVWQDWSSFLEAFAGRCIYAMTTHGRRSYADAAFSPDDVIVFGPETRGLPSPILASLGNDYCLRIPMCRTSRSMNLSNAVAVVVYEAWRQNGFTVDGSAAR